MSPYALTERLWFSKSAGTNYQLWKTHVRHHFQRQDLLRFIDDEEKNPPPPETIISRYNSKVTRNPDYLIWKRIDESLKQGILSLLEDDLIAPDEVGTKNSTSRDIWLHLERKFQKYVEQLHSANVSDEGEDHLLRDWDDYSELFSAALLGDRAAGQQVFSAIEADKMNSKYAMALHVAVGAGEKAIDFVENLVSRMPNDFISVKDAGGNTALSTAATVGNRAAATILVANNSDLLYVPNISGDFPVHVAARNAKRDTLIYLISVTKDDHGDQNPYEGYYGLSLLTSTIEAGFHDIALYLVKKYPYLATLRLSANSALKSIVEQEYRYAYVPMPIDSSSSSSSCALMHPDDIGSNVESLYITPQGVPIITCSQSSELMKSLKTKKQLVTEIVKCLCKEMKSLSFIEVEGVCRDAILIAAKLGNTEIVGEILEAFPSAIHCSNPSFLQSIIHVAVENRRTNVFNIVYRMSDHTHLYLDLPDNDGNNLLHLVAKLAPQRSLNALPNAAIRMLREMEWYKEVENLIHPRCRKQLNSEGKSPQTIFEEEHKSLRAEGEKWVKDAVNSCMIIAALISTIAFAASITVPGGNDNITGLPLFHKNIVFMLFAASNAGSLIASATSLLWLLDASISRYTEEDFSSYITKFIFGLWFLTSSILLMMLTFAAILHLVFGRSDKRFFAVTTVIILGILWLHRFILMPLLFEFITRLGLHSGFLGKPRQVADAKKSVANTKVSTQESV